MILNCPTCKRQIEIPRGTRKIDVCCPTCHSAFVVDGGKLMLDQRKFVRCKLCGAYPFWDRVDRSLGCVMGPRLMLCYTPTCMARYSWNIADHECKHKEFTRLLNEYSYAGLAFEEARRRAKAESGFGTTEHNSDLWELLPCDVELQIEGPEQIAKLVRAGLTPEELERELLQLLGGGSPTKNSHRIIDPD